MPGAPRDDIRDRATVPLPTRVGRLSSTAGTRSSTDRGLSTTVGRRGHHDARDVLFVRQQSLLPFPFICSPRQFQFRGPSIHRAGIISRRQTATGIASAPPVPRRRMSTDAASCHTPLCFSLLPRTVCHHGTGLPEERLGMLHRSSSISGSRQVSRHSSHGCRDARCWYGTIIPNVAHDLRDRRFERADRVAVGRRKRRHRAMRARYALAAASGGVPRASAGLMRRQGAGHASADRRSVSGAQMLKFERRSRACKSPSRCDARSRKSGRADEATRPRRPPAYRRQRNARTRARPHDPRPEPIFASNEQRIAGHATMARRTRDKRNALRVPRSATQ